MEFAVGQLTQKGPIGALAKLCPLLKGKSKIKIRKKLYIYIIKYRYWYSNNSNIILSYNLLYSYNYLGYVLYICIICK